MDANMEQSFNKFKSLVLDDAQKQREEISSDIERKTNEELEKKQTEFLGEAYKTIQQNISVIQKANKEKILQRELDSKKDVILYREKIVDKVFCEVKEKLSEYMTTGEYAEWLNTKIKSALSECGEGEKTVFLNSKDAEIISAGAAKVEICEMLGGVKVSNTSKGIIIDYSIEELLSEQKQNFLKNSGLTIEI